MKPSDGRDGGDDAGPTPLLDYQRPGPGADAPAEIVVPPPGPHVPPDLFPPYCCSCLAPTDQRWTAIFGLAAPMCRRCRRRWGVALATVTAGSTLATGGLFGWLLFRTRGTSQLNALDWATAVCALTFFPAVALVGSLVAVGWTVFPFRVLRRRDDPTNRRYVRFANAEYHRLAAQWLDSTRREVARRNGPYPVPPKSLKGARRRRPG